LSTLLAVRIGEAQLDREVARLTWDEGRLAELPADGDAYAEEYARLRVRWAQTLMEAAALGAQEAAPGAGWSYLKPLLQMQSATAGLDRKRRIRVAGGEMEEEGLRVVPSADSASEIVRMAGRGALQILPAVSDARFLYLRADPPFVPRGAAPLRV